MMDGRTLTAEDRKAKKAPCNGYCYKNTCSTHFFVRFSAIKKRLLSNPFENSRITALFSKTQTTPLAIFEMIGRSLLASSHAGTRLPIAVISAGHRALPLCPSASRTIPWIQRNLSEIFVCTYFVFSLPPFESHSQASPFLPYNKKRSYPLDNFFVFVYFSTGFPTLALSKSGIWVKDMIFLSACHTSSPLSM